MVLEEGENHYKAITWNNAFQLISDELKKLENPNQAIFYTSGRTSNEAAFLWQMLARGFGTNNLPDCSNMCHESSGVALTDSIGIGKGTVTLDDFNKADLILVVGQNPGTNHPRMLTALRDAKRRGGSVISINPLIETGMKKFKHPQNPLEILGSGTEIADDHYQININSDQALFYGINSHLVENEMIDNNFISEYTHGYEKFRKSFEGVNWKEIEISTGINESRIRGLGEIIGKAKSVIICWAMGITQHRNSVPTIQEMVNTLLLGGNIGRAGAGVCPVRGHSNVQGDRTVGINHKPSDAFISKLEISTGIKTPKKHGFDAVEAVQAMISGEGKVFLSMGGNFLSAMSDTNLVSDALENCELTVQSQGEKL
jgi:molybdopterin-dependent oxidoreductase alpha subunit